MNMFSFIHENLKGGGGFFSSNFVKRPVNVDHMIFFKVQVVIF